MTEYNKPQTTWPHTQYNRVPDFSDGDYDPQNIKHSQQAKHQRARELKIAIEEFRMIQEQLSVCYYRENPDHHNQCKHLVDEYKERTTWKHQLPPVDYKGETAVRLRILPDGSAKMIYD